MAWGLSLCAGGVSSKGGSGASNCKKGGSIKPPGYTTCHSRDPPATVLCDLIVVVLFFYFVSLSSVSWNSVSGK